MQNTSQAYKTILASGDYETETMVMIENANHTMTEYHENSLMNVSLDRSAFGGDNLAIGCACSATCSLTLISDTELGRDLSNNIPKGARIEIYERLVSRNGYPKESEWLCQGVFFVDERDDTSWTGRLSLNGVDAMVRADAMFPGTGGGWPSGGRTDREVVQMIAAAMDVNVVGLNAKLNRSYRIPFPGTYTMREVLGYIGAMYCGNWVIDAGGNLCLLKFGELPEETYYLIDNQSNYITMTSDDLHIYVRDDGIYVEVTAGG